MGKKNEKIKIATRLSQNKNRKVVQYDKDGKKLNEFGSCVEAYEKTGISNDCISHCCRGKYKTAGGFVWKYEKIE